MTQYSVKNLEEWDERFNGTSLTGYITSSYQQLVEVFGEPGSKTDGYKTDAEWLIELTNDEHAITHVLTIYNYKDGKNYLKADGLNTTDITEWHVGSKTNDAIRALDRHIESLGLSRDMRVSTAY